MQTVLALPRNEKEEPPTHSYCINAHSGCSIYPNKKYLGILFLFGLIACVFIVLMFPNQVSPSRRDENEYAITEPYFPIAFSLRAYRDAAHLLRLLQAIYRPQNQYCIHVSQMTGSELQNVIKTGLSSFGQNVFLVPESKRVYIELSKVSLVEADLVCAQLLLERNSEWFYWINLDGSEYPLKTNWELITALQIMNGSNLVEGEVYKPWRSMLTMSEYMDMQRITREICKRMFSYISLCFILITWMTGSETVAVPPDFVKFALQNEQAGLLLDAFRAYEDDVSMNASPGESFFATLNHNPSIFPVPGASSSSDNDSHESPVLAYYIYKNKRCEHTFPRKLCQWQKSDISFLKAHPHFFASEFDPDSKRAIITELEQWHREKLRHEAQYHQLHPTFNMRYYAQMKFPAEIQ